MNHETQEESGVPQGDERHGLSGPAGAGPKATLPGDPSP
jgi:hypothetical protein